jgi:integrase
MVAQLKLKVANGIDPLAEREAEKLAAEAAARAAQLELERQQQTFQKVAEAYIATHEAGWSNAKHIQQWTNTLKTYVYPKIGSKTVDAITTADVVAILKPIWAKKPETASRVRMRIEAVLNSAKALGWREGENPAVWKGGLDAVLPRRGRSRRCAITRPCLCLGACLHGSSEGARGYGRAGARVHHPDGGALR